MSLISMMKFKKRGNKKQKRPKVLAKLEPKELRKLIEQRRLLTDAEMTLSMLQCSYRVLWRALQEKYGLPDNVDLDEVKGRVLEKISADG